MSILSKKILKHSAANTVALSLALLAGTSHLALAVPLPSPALPVPVNANPNIATFGNATLTKTKTTETITVNSTSASGNNAIINWQKFDIGAGDRVDFVQPSTTSVVLNRVTGSTSASQISGFLHSNGMLFLVNTNGIIFNQGSQVNVGGLVATTSDIKDSDFEAGNYKFSPNLHKKPIEEFDRNERGDTASIINNGTITVNQDNSLVALVGHTVENNGLIQAKIQNTSPKNSERKIANDATGNKIELAAADSFTVDLNGDNLINLAVTDPSVKRVLAENQGAITANGGTIVMTAGVAEKTINSIINMQGVLQADSVNTKNGSIQLVAGGDNSFVTVSGSARAKNGSITVAAAHTDIQEGASLKAKGGTIETSGTDSLQIDSGVTIKANTWTIDPSSVLIANDSEAPFVSASTLGGALDHGVNIIITSTGNIEVANSIIKKKGHDVSLTMNAGTDITLDGGVSILSKAGKLDVTLNAGTANKGGAVALYSGSAILSHGGNITITGTGDASHFAGVDLEFTRLDAQGGSVTLTGTGSKAGTFSLNDGVLLLDSTIATKGEGSITITGTSGGGGGPGRSTEDSPIPIFNDGVLIVGIHNGSTITTTDGAITITGIAGPRGTGIAVIGNIFGEDFSPSLIGGKRTHGNITLIADTLNVGSNLDIETTSNVTFKPYTLGTDIGVAGAEGTLQITRDLLDNVRASSITIGNLSDTGVLTANRYDWDPPTSAPAVSFLNGGDIVINGMQIMGRGTFLAESANGSITLGEEGGVSSVAEGTPIVLAASNGNFINNNTGEEASLSAENGRWLVYSSSPDGDIFGNLNSNNTAVWNTSYPTSVPDADTGNRYVFAFQPTVTITPNDLSKTYGQDFTAQVANDGFAVTGVSAGVAGAFLPDTLNSVVTGTLNISSLGAPATANVAGSPYAITASGLTGTGGYAVNFVDGHLVVDPAQLTITADNQSKTYGQTLPFFGTTTAFSTHGLVNEDYVNTVKFFDFGASSGASVLGGPYAISIFGASGSAGLTSNYNIHYVGGQLTVNPAALTITANNVTMTYGDGNNFNGYKVKGLVNGDSISSVNLATNATSSGSGNWNAGSWVITPSGAAGNLPIIILPETLHKLSTTTYILRPGTFVASNYTITYVNGVLQVNPAPVAVAANDRFMPLGGPLPFLTYTNSLLISGDSPDTVFSGGLATIAVAHSLPGFYDITRGTLTTNPNYKIVTFLPGTLAVADPTSPVGAALEQALKTPHIGRISPNGTLLAMVTGTGGNTGGTPQINFANLSPAALANLSPAALENLAPAAGGPGTSLVSLIECSAESPCGLSQ